MYFQRSLSLASPKSALKIRGNDSKDASKAATQMTPGPSARNSTGSGPTPSGKSDTTIT